MTVISSVLSLQVETADFRDTLKHADLRNLTNQQLGIPKV